MQVDILYDAVSIGVTLITKGNLCSNFLVACFCSQDQAQSQALRAFFVVIVSPLFCQKYEWGF